MVPDYLEQGDVKQVLTQLSDGSTWTAEIGLDGKLRLLEQLSEPDGSKKPQEFEAEEETEQQEPEPSEPEEGESGEGDANEANAWGEETQEEQEYSPDSVDELLKDMEHRDMRGGSSDKKSQWGNRNKLPTDLLKKSKDPAFKSRLSSVMLDNKYDRRVKGRTRGKLDMTRLFKIPTGSRSVFMQKESRKGKNYSVVLLVDVSSSMLDADKALLAAESVVFLTKQLTEIGINVGIVAFENQVYTVKELQTKPDYNHIYQEIANARGGTNDYAGMRRAYHMLQKAPQGKKILVMLSDGSPGHYFDTEYYDVNGKKETFIKPLYRPGFQYGEGNSPDYNQKQHLHHLVRSQKDVESIGIGIREGGWQIPDHEVIQDVHALKRTIIKQLRKHIRRG